MRLQARRPIRAVTVLPPTTAHGWARGLAGTAKTRTALAPTGATSQGDRCRALATARLARAAKAMPRPPPSAPRKRSGQDTATRRGMKADKEYMAGVLALA